MEVCEKDAIVKAVLMKQIGRSLIGHRKYGVTMDRDDLSVCDWLTHLQEELMDASIYIEKLKSVIPPELTDNRVEH